MHTGDKAILRESLPLTPIERLIVAFEFYAERAIGTRLVECYECALRELLNEDVRDELIRTSPASIEDVDQAMPASFKKLHEVSDDILGLLTQFVLNRRADWPEKFYRNWLF